MVVMDYMLAVWQNLASCWDRPRRRTYERELTELLIVDPCNDFLSVGSKLFELSRSTLEAHDVVEHMREVLVAASH